MKATIAGLGSWLPRTVRGNDSWPATFIEAARARRGDRTLVDVPPANRDRADVLVAEQLILDDQDPFLRCRERRVATADELAVEAEVAAAHAALRDANIEGAQVDVVMSWSILTDRAMLPAASRVAEAVGASSAYALGTDAGCASGPIQLDLAQALIEAGRARTVLLTQSHLINRAFPMTHPASPGAGDGATAVVVTAAEQPGVLATVAVSDGEYDHAVTWVRDRDEAGDTPWWTGGPELFPGSRNSKAAKRLMMNTARFAERTCMAALKRSGVRPGEVDVVGCVQPRGWLPSTLATLLGVPTARAPSTFEHLGHLGGCGVFMNLLEARRRGLLKPGALVLLYAQGAGFTRAASVCRMPP